jgi:hypothetical protein
VTAETDFDQRNAEAQRAAARDRTPNSARFLFDAARRELEQGSSIGPAVIAERGYESIHRPTNGDQRSRERLHSLKIPTWATKETPTSQVFSSRYTGRPGRGSVSIGNRASRYPTGTEASGSTPARRAKPAGSTYTPGTGTRSLTRPRSCGVPKGSRRLTRSPAGVCASLRLPASSTGAPRWAPSAIGKTYYSRAASSLSASTPTPAPTPTFSGPCSRLAAG